MLFRSFSLMLGPYRPSYFPYYTTRHLNAHLLAIRHPNFVPQHGSVRGWYINVTGPRRVPNIATNTWWACHMHSYGNNGIPPSNMAVPLLPSLLHWDQKSLLNCTVEDVAWRLHLAFGHKCFLPFLHCQLLYLATPEEPPRYPSLPYGSSITYPKEKRKKW